MPEINAPAVVAEVCALHDAYERALAEHDVPALTDFFWNSPHVVRYGVGEHLYGAEALAAYRQATTRAFSDRQLLRRAVAAFGADTASVMCELQQTVLGRTRRSRQSQLWIRFPVIGWKIVSAHVSHAQRPPGWDEYVDQATIAVGLPLDPAHRPGVVQQLQRTAALVAPLLAFPLPADVEPAPLFTA